MIRCYPHSAHVYDYYSTYEYSELYVVAYLAATQNGSRQEVWESGHK